MKGVGANMLLLSLVIFDLFCLSLDETKELNRFVHATKHHIYSKGNTLKFWPE